jgi:tetratricopeptide (TPR) repeat protein
MRDVLVRVPQRPREARQLQRRELIHHRLEFEYNFKHAVTQDVTYNSLLMAKRKELHRVTAEAIESLFPDQVEELTPALAYHYERAESPEKAIHYLTSAAEHARSTYSNAEAIIFYRAALQQARTGGKWARQAVELYEKLGGVLTLTGEHEQARQVYEDALAQLPGSDRVWQSRLRRMEGNTWMPPREFEKALKAYQLAETVLGPGSEGEDSDWRREWLENQLDRVWAHYWANQVAEMVSLVDRVRPLIEAYGTPIQRARFFRCVVLMAWRRDRFQVPEETLIFVHAALAAAQESGDPHEIAFSTTMLGMSHLWRGELDQAEGNLRRSLGLSEKIGDLECQVLSQTYLTVTSRRRHQIEPTRNHARRSEEAAAGRMPIYVGVARANLAWAAWAEGNLAEAEVEGRRALDDYGVGNHPFKWLALWPLGAVAVARGNDAEAISRLRKLIPPPEMRMPQQLEYLLQDAVTAWDAGEVDTVHTLLERSIELARQTGWL